MNNTETFLDLYKQLEHAVRDEYNLRADDSAIYFLANRRKEFSQYRNTLHVCREVRNLLQHNQLVNGQYPVEPAPELTKCLQTCLNRINKPVRALNLMVSFENLVCCAPNDCPLDALKSLLKGGFHYVPIVEGKRVFGVFSADTIAQYFNNGGLDLSGLEAVTFQDEPIKSYTAFDAHLTESFKFVSKTALYSDIDTLFDNAQSTDKKLAMVFVTENGSPKEQLLGAISAADMIGYKLD